MCDLIIIQPEHGSIAIYTGATSAVVQPNKITKVTLYIYEVTLIRWSYVWQGIFFLRLLADFRLSGLIFGPLSAWNQPITSQVRFRKGHFSPTNWLPEWTLYGRCFSSHKIYRAYMYWSTDMHSLLPVDWNLSASNLSPFLVNRVDIAEILMRSVCWQFVNMGNIKSYGLFDCC